MPSILFITVMYDISFPQYIYFTASQTVELMIEADCRNFQEARILETEMYKTTEYSNYSCHWSYHTVVCQCLMILL